ncbi:MAG TPA: YoaK family protein, partial [Steroidobacteraceae bacterium]|nr:YoaK family protein [Steroidobacteraceae bacterium]
HQYTSHMTGIISAMANNMLQGSFALVLAGLGAVLSFLAGAACTAILVNYARRQHARMAGSTPLLLEALLLLGFGLLGARLTHLEGMFVPFTVMLLCFMMGLQNALITKLSNAEIRTTHVTGIVTDIGIEVGKFLYWNDPRHTERPVRANPVRLRLLTILLSAFFLGGASGALGFARMGYAACVPLALVLALLAAAPLLQDLLLARRRTS